MGRPTKLSEDLIQNLEAAFKAGQVSIDKACEYVGIATSTYMNWQKRGKAGEEPYVEFLDRIKKARAEAEMFNIAMIRQAAASGSWQAAAWWLERTNPKVWGRKSEVTVITPDAIEREIARLEAELADNDA